jgi:hypothetical protein
MKIRQGRDPLLHSMVTRSDLCTVQMHDSRQTREVFKRGCRDACRAPRVCQSEGAEEKQLIRYITPKQTSSLIPL